MYTHTHILTIRMCTWKQAYTQIVVATWLLVLHSCVMVMSRERVPRGARERKRERRTEQSREVALFVCRQLRGGNSSQLALSHAIALPCTTYVYMYAYMSECFAGVCSNYYFIITFFPLVRFVLCFYVLNAFVVIAAAVAAASAAAAGAPQTFLSQQKFAYVCMYLLVCVYVCVRVFMARRTRTYMYMYMTVCVCCT